MKKAKYLIIAAAAALALSVGVFAQQPSARSAPVKADTTAAQQRVDRQSPGQPVDRQAMVQKPTKRTNWSKIKTLFE